MSNYDICVKEIPENEPILVEIGSWLGKSSVLLELGIRKKKSPRLYCIDPFNAYGDNESMKEYHRIKKTLKKLLIEEFTDNIRAVGYDKYITILQGYSYEFSPNWRLGIDFLFIDGDHTYQSVLRDFQEWSPHIKGGGIIAFHDVIFDEKAEHVQGPRKVVQNYIFNNNNWVILKYVDSLFIVKKRTKQAIYVAPTYFF